MTFTELIIVPAYLSGFFLIAALTQLLLGAPLYSALTSIVLCVGNLAKLSKPLLAIRWVLATLAAILVTLPLIFVILHSMLAFERRLAVISAALLSAMVACLILWRAPRELQQP